MSSKIPSLRLLAVMLATCGLLLAAPAVAQEDAPSLGDLARNLRKNKTQQGPQAPAAAPVIDNDNLQQVMEDAKNARPMRQDKTVLSIDPVTDHVKVSSPDVTCSLSFNSQASSLIIKPILVEDLPLTELLKIDGPGSIQEGNLDLQVFNGTDWNLHEITIGLTLERKPGENAELAARARVIPASEGGAPVAIERRSDVTLLYHLKAEAKPFSTTVFHENIGITPGPDEDWRWSIVEAKGVPPAQTATPDSLSDPLFASPSAILPGLSQPQTPPGPVPVAPAAPIAPSPERSAPEKANPEKTRTTASAVSPQR